MPETADLVAELHAEIEPFKRGMREAISTTDQTAARINSSLQSIERSFGSVKSAVTDVKGAVAEFSRVAVGGFALGGVVKAIGETLSSLQKIGEAADKIGVTTTAFQEFAFAMGRAGVGQADQAELLAKFAENADEASKEFGGLFDALGTYNTGARAALKGTTDLQQQLGIVANAVKTAAGEQERAAIITAAFGKSNDDLRRFLMGGASAIDDTIQKARELGIAVDEDLIRRAGEVSEQFAAAAAIIRTEFQSALIGLAPTLVMVAEHMATLFGWIQSSVEGWRLLANEFTARSDFGEVATRATTSLTIQIRDMRGEIEKLQGEISAGPGIIEGLFGEGAVEKHDRMMRLIAEVTKLEAELGRRGWAASQENTPAFRSVGPPEAKEDPLKKSAIDRAANELVKIEQDYLKATKQVTELARAEYQKRLADLDKLLADQLISSEDYVKARAELEATLTARLAEEAQKQLKPVSDAISGTLSRAFDDFIQRGELNFKKMAASMIAELAKVQFQMAILQPLFGGGSTQGGGLFGQALAGVFHEGGTVGAGGRSRAVPGLAFAMAPRMHGGGVAGLKAGEVPAILERGETVLPKGMRGGGQQIIVNIQTPNPEAFRQSEGQIASMITRAASRGQRNM